MSVTKSIDAPAAAGVSDSSKNGSAAKQSSSKEIEIAGSPVKETPAPVPTSEDTERVVSVAVEAKDEATGAGSTGVEPEQERNDGGCCSQRIISEERKDYCRCA